jgi:hypothetical protein
MDHFIAINIPPDLRKVGALQHFESIPQIPRKKQSDVHNIPCNIDRDYPNLRRQIYLLIFRVNGSGDWLLVNRKDIML